MTTPDKSTPLPSDLRERLQEESPDERAELERTWHLLDAGRLPDEDLPEAKATWAALQPHLPDTSGSTPSASRPPVGHRSEARSRSVRRWVGGIAAVMVLAVAGLLFWRQPVHVSAPDGAHRVVSLADGSTVELNSGTTLSYRRGFDGWPFLSAQRRTVELRGEAFFDVSEEERPFIVKTFNARVRVLGTRFNVRAWPETSSSETRVTLTAGSVQVAADRDGSGQPVLLNRAGQSSRVPVEATEPTPPQSTSIERTTAWRRQGFAASDQALPALFTELERRFDVRITLQAPSARADSMTLFYPQQVDVETILHDICTAQRLSFRPTSRGYVVYQK